MPPSAGFGASLGCVLRELGMIRVQGASSERKNELASGAACTSARECSDLCTLARGGRRDMALCFTLYFLSHSGRRPRHGVDRCALRPLLFSHPTCAQLMFALTATLTAPFAAHRLTLLKPHMLVLLARARRPMFSYIFLRFSMLLEATTSNDDSLLENLCNACALVRLARSSV